MFRARFRTCMSSVMRCRRGVMESSFAKGMCCKQPLHAFAWEFSEKGGERIRQRGLFALKCWCHAIWRPVEVTLPDSRYVE